MKARLGGRNIELQAAHVTSSDEEQVIYPDEGYYGFSSITVGAVQMSGGSGTGPGTGGDGDDTGDDTKPEYPSLEDSALTYETTTMEVPTGRYFYGTYSKSLLACPMGAYTVLYGSDYGLTVLCTDYPMVLGVSGNLGINSSEYGYAVKYNYSVYSYNSETEEWTLISSGIGTISNGFKRNVIYWSNYDVVWTTTGKVECAASSPVPETERVETLAPTVTDAFYTIKGDTVTNLGATVYQITGQQATTPEDMFAALNYYAALNKKAAEEPTE
jgi:hypothetical protein